MTANETRKAFLDYFAERGHRVVPSSPLVLPKDPTLLFANAGMNQFKDVFTGREAREYTRAVSSQKCLRVSGKHNDLETVGRTPRHHTFFEMLGNFSFGDYFKKEAVEYAWDLVTRVYQLPEDRLWVTVFGGTESIPADDDAGKLWREVIGLPEERILRLGEKDNFWRMGDRGPCGPCSELHFDLGVDLTSVAGESNPGTDERRFLEIWNLVFMQFDQQSDAAVVPLPAPSIDTGMGLERIASILQGKRSNYDTDLFVPILTAAAERAGVAYGQDPESDLALRVIADHARAFCFLTADGVVPANDKRGYVLRRLLRRAIRFGRKLGIGEPFLHDVTPVVIDGLGDHYPELLAAQDAVLEIGKLEEQRFADTLSTGLRMLEDSLAAVKPSTDDAQPVLPGKDLFRLYDTFGFPLDLARDIAEERGIALDEPGFEAEMTRQRSRAQASWKQVKTEQASGVYAELAGRLQTEFAGYTAVRLDGVGVRALLRDGKPVEVLERGEAGEVVLDITPFYAESGGQVADTGFLAASSGHAEVLDVQRPVPGLIVHRVKLETGALELGESVTAEIDTRRRAATRRNHTATHLLHAALRDVVGTHVKQAGSRVAPDRLRFDFTHFSGLHDHALADIELLINRAVMDDLPVETDEMELDEAIAAGAMALFGEKYGDRVRVVRVGDFSMELCGGTHTARTGEIGLIKLLHERGISSGTRRVEAVSGEGSLAAFRADQQVVRTLEEQLSVPRTKLLEEVDRRLDRVRALQRELEQERLKAVRQQLLDCTADAPIVAGIRVLARRVEGLAPQETRELADALRGKLHSGVVVLGRADGPKASLLVAVTDDLTKRVPAGDLVRCLAKIIGGGGGGRPDMAEAGGRNPERLDEALGRAAEEVARRMEASPSN